MFTHKPDIFRYNLVPSCTETRSNYVLGMHNIKTVRVVM
jgi:hypothetical protein